ncbi:hypothetical protein niasHT_037265 [Heterodera trifolii]|uniref:Methyltransferase domain-containing protein n=1 Tax=Heterodera trifolii TaxID=157864 RepID=A0ABD2J5C6_9BILA
MVPIDANDLRGLLAFVHAYAHLYETLNVEFFSARVFERIDAEWLSFLCRLDSAQLNMVPVEFEQYLDCPASLKHFFASARRFSLLDKYSTPFVDQQHNNKYSSPEQLRKVKRKKAHELGAFSELLRAECAPLDIDRVVDIGCGLGHLGRVLRLNNNESLQQQQTSNDNNSSLLLDYVGIEANPALCHSARQNDLKMENIVFGGGTGHDDGSSSSSEQCRNILTLPGCRTAIVSLHGCGELQRQILLEFVAMCKQQTAKHPKLLVTVGCCYHKLSNWTDSAIERWMLSSQMRDLFLDTFGHNHFPIPGLRLACQATLVRWMVFTEQQHTAHRQAFANRAFVECLRMHKTAATKAKSANYVPHRHSSNSTNCEKVDDNDHNGGGDLLQMHQRRPPRKLNKCMLVNNNLDEFRTEVMRRSAIVEEERDEFEQTLDQIMDTYSPAVRFIEPFTALQFALQCPLESLVLLDRLLFLRENGIGGAELVRLFDPAISPRCVAIVARMDEQ